jgi:Beta-propeller domains of methanol dehydrogenase type
MKRLLLLLSLFFAFFSVSVYAEEIPSSPPSNGVYDPHGYLNKDVVDKVGELNKEWSETTLKPQIAVAIVDSLDKDIESVANETARAWKVGYSGTDNGILLVIAIKDKKIRTETSNNLSTLITDSKASSLNNTVKSDFRRGDYSAGVSAYLSELSGFMTPYLSNPASEIKEKKSEEEKETLDKIAKFVFKLPLLILTVLLPLMLPILLIQYLIKRYDNRYSGYTGYTENHNRGYYVSQSIKAYNDDVDSDDDYYHSKKSSSSGSSGDSSYYSGDSGSSSYYSGDSGSSSYSSGDSSSSWSGGDSWSGGGFDGGGSSGDW